LPEPLAFAEAPLDWKEGAALADAPPAPLENEAVFGLTEFEPVDEPTDKGALTPSEARLEAPLVWEEGVAFVEKPLADPEFGELVEFCALVLLAELIPDEESEIEGASVASGAL
jgi:hypothetical protein